MSNPRILKPFEVWSVNGTPSPGGKDWNDGRRPGVVTSAEVLMTSPTDPWAFATPLSHTIGTTQSVRIPDAHPSGLAKNEPSSILCDHLYSYPVTPAVFRHRRGSVRDLAPSIRQAIRSTFSSYERPGKGLDAGDIVPIAFSPVAVIPCVVISSTRANQNHPLLLITVVQTVRHEEGDAEGPRSFPLLNYENALAAKLTVDAALISTVWQRCVHGPPIASLQPDDLAALIGRIEGLLA